MNTRDEFNAWLQFARGWSHENPVPGWRCPCAPCHSGRALQAWARGEHETQPPIKVLRNTLRWNEIVERQRRAREDERRRQPLR